MRKLRLIGLVIGLCALAAAFSGGGGAVTPPGTVVMSNLDNPRHLAFGPEGGLYVAEAGRGGSGPCIFIRGATQCAGPSGAVSRLWKGVQTRIVTGLPSYAAAPGNGATGPHAVSLHGRGGAYVTVGLGGESIPPSAFRALMGQGFGRTARFKPNGSWSYEDDIAGYEEANNPDGGVLDSNPYAILAQPGGRVVTDAAGNDLLRVGSNGHISTLAVFPSRPGRATDSVPTSVAVGPDGAYYVGELSGVPFNVDDAHVYRVVPGQPPQEYGPTFSFIIDLAWGPDGHLYVLQFATGPGLTGPGILYRLETDGTKTPVVTDLVAPGGIVFGPDGALYISNKSVLAGAGEVLRFGP
ncbi:MAG: SMP-30/gluconolactonase/LRE family protein [Actinobacteria bacterium]|nr:MAG: SMP-30/gluconolactonase/LRE family protein [Actinomycetota bacterium]